NGIVAAEAHYLLAAGKAAPPDVFRSVSLAHAPAVSACRARLGLGGGTGQKSQTQGSGKDRDPRHSASLGPVEAIGDAGAAGLSSAAHLGRRPEEWTLKANCSSAKAPSRNI